MPLHFYLTKDVVEPGEPGVLYSVSSRSTDQPEHNWERIWLDKKCTDAARRIAQVLAVLKLGSLISYPLDIRGETWWNRPWSRMARGNIREAIQNAISTVMPEVKERMERYLQKFPHQQRKQKETEYPVLFQKNNGKIMRGLVTPDEFELWSYEKGHSPKKLTLDQLRMFVIEQDEYARQSKKEVCDAIQSNNDKIVVALIQQLANPEERVFHNALRMHLLIAAGCHPPESQKAIFSLKPEKLIQQAKNGVQYSDLPEECRDRLMKIVGFYDNMFRYTLMRLGNEKTNNPSRSSEYLWRATASDAKKATLDHINETKQWERLKVPCQTLKALVEEFFAVQKHPLSVLGEIASVRIKIQGKIWRVILHEGVWEGGDSESYVYPAPSSVFLPYDQATLKELRKLWKADGPNRNKKTYTFTILPEDKDAACSSEFKSPALAAKIVELIKGLQTDFHIEGLDLCDADELTEADITAEESPVGNARQDANRVPPPIEGFQGDDRFMTVNNIITNMKGGDTAASIASVSGQGGIGKTQLARQVVSTWFASPECGFLLAFEINCRAHNVSSPPLSCDEVARAILREFDVAETVIDARVRQAGPGREEDALVAFCHEKFMSVDALIVLDNASMEVTANTKVPAVLRFIPAEGARSRIIVTSREEASWDVSIGRQRVTSWQKQDIQQYLQCRGLELNEKGVSVLDEIGDITNGVPLLVTLLAAYYKKRPFSWGHIGTEIRSLINERAGMYKSPHVHCVVEYCRRSIEKTPLADALQALSCFPMHFDEASCAVLWNVEIGEAKGMLEELCALGFVTRSLQDPLASSSNFEVQTQSSANGEYRDWLEKLKPLLKDKRFNLETACEAWMLAKNQYQAMERIDLLVRARVVRPVKRDLAGYRLHDLIREELKRAFFSEHAEDAKKKWMALEQRLALYGIGLVSVCNDFILNRPTPQIAPSYPGTVDPAGRLVGLESFEIGSGLFNNEKFNLSEIFRRCVGYGFGDAGSKWLTSRRSKGECDADLAWTEPFKELVLNADFVRLVSMMAGAGTRACDLLMDVETRRVWAEVGLSASLVSSRVLMEQAVHYNNLGLAHRHRGRSRDVTEYYLNRSVEIARAQIKTSTGSLERLWYRAAAAALGNLGTMAYERYDAATTMEAKRKYLNDAWNYHEEALRFSLEAGDHIGRGIDHGNRGLVLQAAHESGIELEHAGISARHLAAAVMEEYQKRIDLAEKYGDLRGRGNGGNLAWALLQRWRIQRSTEDASGALERFRISIVCHKRVQNARGIAAGESNLAIALTEVGLYNNCSKEWQGQIDEHHLRSCRIFEKESDREGHWKACWNRAWSAVQHDHVNSALFIAEVNELGSRLGKDDFGPQSKPLKMLADKYGKLVELPFDETQFDESSRLASEVKKAREIIMTRISKVVGSA